jgi:hypothetical protein
MCHLSRENLQGLTAASEFISFVLVARGVRMIVSIFVLDDTHSPQDGRPPMTAAAFHRARTMTSAG